MKYTQKDVLQFVEENDVKFIKLMFCDIYGQLKTISIISSDLPQVFANGLAFDASKVSGFMNETDGDLRLYPDLNTLELLPWRPQHGRVVRFFCYIKKSDGTPFEGDSRKFLSDAVELARSKGYFFMFGTSCEFYAFEMDQNGNPTKTPHDYAGYCDSAPADRGENLRREICLTLEKMDIIPQSSRHESGPGQNEIDFQSSNPLNAADNLITFKNAVKTISWRNGMYATFMPKPLTDESGSGLQIYISCMKNGKNIFRKSLGSKLVEARKMICGLLNHAADMTLFLNSTTNSYTRLGKDYAPVHISWTQKNFPQLIKARLIDSEEADIVFRSPDNACNPYFALGLLIYACLDGIENGNADDFEPCDFDINYEYIEKVSSEIGHLPATLKDAADLAQTSEFMKKHLPESVLNFFVKEKCLAWKEFEQADDKEAFESDKYFYSL